MEITAQTVSVDYAPQLAMCLPRWKATCARVLVVTAERDTETRLLCERLEVETLLTDVFWRHGAKFNKGAAIAEGFNHLQPAGWHLFFDADILPPPNWTEQLKRWNLRECCLYGSDRYLETGALIREGELAGCFHLAHASAKGMQVRPIVDTFWTHAGNYDSNFQARWNQHERVKLPLKLTHLGNPFRNWCGVGNDQGMNDLFSERRRRAGWQHERITESD